MDQITPVQIWNAVMEKYKVAQRCEQELSRLGSVVDGTQREQLLQERALAVAAAAQALADVYHREIIATLRDLKRLDEAPGVRLDIVHSKDCLSNRHPLFWCSCFMRLSPRGDCAEKLPGRSTFLASW